MCRPLKRNIFLSVRVTTEEYLRIKKKASKEHRSVTEFVVRQCLGVPEVAKPILKFKKAPRYPHQRSEGTTRRGEARQERLQLGVSKGKLSRTP